ncbi:MAG: hypothetical protein WD049_09750 [Candidatus Paceibacterota bacterium]
MAEDLTENDDERRRYDEAFANGCRFAGYVELKRRVQDDVRRYLGLTRQEFLDRLLDYLRNGGRLSKVTEKRDSDFDEFYFEFHHDMRPELGNRTIYVETRFKDADALDDRTIYIVSVHPPDSVNWK